MLDKIKTVGVVFKPDDTTLIKNYNQILEILKRYDIELLLEKNSAKLLNKTGLDFDRLCKNCDFLLSIGGDGTIISTARKAYGYDIPILGINFGKLGFLVDIVQDEFESFIKDMKIKNYKIDKRMMLQFAQNKERFYSFNDIVICKKSMKGLVDISAKIQSKKFNHYRGDGVIISTPTGSTAYNLSCGGPVVYPLGCGIIVTPISAHSLTQRPVVLPQSFELEFENCGKEDVLVILDGQEVKELNIGETIFISQAPKKARLIHKTEKNYFDSLNKKLRWSDYDR